MLVGSCGSNGGMRSLGGTGEEQRRRKKIVVLLKKTVTKCVSEYITLKKIACGAKFQKFQLFLKYLVF